MDNIFRKVVYKLFYSSIHKSSYLNYGRDVISSWMDTYLKNLATHNEINILDVGVGHGIDLVNIKTIFENNGKNVNMHGVENHKPNIDIASKKGIKVFCVNIENDFMPFKNKSFDIIIANQVLEHTKEIFWIFGEMSRLLNENGIILLGVPNLASLHNRAMLLFGEQPTSIEPLGPHVRGFTYPALQRLITTDDYFRVLDVKGSNFYPFPPFLSKPLSKLLPYLSTTIFFLIQRTSKKGNFINVLDDRFFETPYFTG